MFSSWSENETRDATVILHLLKQTFVQHCHDPLVAEKHDLQELAKTYHQLVFAGKRLADSPFNRYSSSTSRKWTATRNRPAWNDS